MTDWIEDLFDWWADVRRPVRDRHWQAVLPVIVAAVVAVLMVVALMWLPGLP